MARGPLDVNPDASNPTVAGDARQGGNRPLDTGLELRCRRHVDLQSASSLASCGIVPQPPHRTGRARFPWHPALQSSSWLPCGTSSVYVFVAVAADDEGLAAGGGHPEGP